MDTAAHWPQEMGLVKPMEEMVQNTCTKPMPTTERRATRPQKEQALNCPRCNSTNTKFCYYNNYSLTQPRYFCKTCRRYWTDGGSLRNVPVGGGSRKNNKRSSSSSSMSSAISSSSLSPPSSKKLHDLNPPSSSSQNPKIDLKLAFQTIDDYHTISEFVELPNSTHEKDNINTSSSTTTPLSALDLLRTGITSRDMNMSSFMPMPMIDTNASYSSGYALHDFKPTLDFGVNGLGGSGYGCLQGGQGSASGRLLFPFEDLKNVSSTNGDHNHDFYPMEYQISGIPVADGITGTEFETCRRHLGWEELRDSNK